MTEKGCFTCKFCKKTANGYGNIWHHQNCSRWPQKVTDGTGKILGSWFISAGGNMMAYTC